MDTAQVLTKRCTKCGIEYPATSEYFARTKWRKDGFQHQCKHCDKQYRIDHKDNARIWRAEHKDQYPLYDIAQQLKTLYKMSLIDYNTMLKKQKGGCAICHKPETAMYKGILRRLGVDHNHKTGQIRGLLCSKCNSLIGLAKDNTTILESAIQYLSPDTV